MDIHNLLHDAKIYGINYDENSRDLSLYIKSTTKEKSMLVFFETVDWWFAGFTSNNVVFDIRILESEEDKKKLINEQHILDHYADKLVNEKFTYYEIVSSEGMDGSIIAKGMELKPIA